MRYILSIAFACLVASVACNRVPGYGLIRNYGQQLEEVKEQIYFQNCREHSCHQADYHGYECHDGYCDQICDLRKCWRPKKEIAFKKTKVGAAIIFNGCYTDKCNDDLYHGYECHEGRCAHICDNRECWKPEHKEIVGKAKFVGEIVFEGCYEESCHRDKYHGYNCHGGHCDKICDHDRCWEPERTEFKGKAKLVGEVIFEGCYEDRCHNDIYHGYHCREGKCEHVCDKRKCWKPEYVKHSKSAKFVGDVYFEGCYEESCHRDDYHGYDCHKGHCKQICDYHRCWEPKRTEFTGKAKVVGEVIFEGCYEDKCHNDLYHGYHCREGRCDHVCDDHKCWKPEYKEFVGKAKFVAEVYFEGCYEESCHRGEYHGYDCHEGHCKQICDYHRCWEPKRTEFKGKAKVVGEVIFEGCYEDKCHNDLYHGYQCREGRCDHVCDSHRCWKPEYSSFVGKTRATGRIFFEGCVEETCHKEKYDGFFCNAGRCEFVCDPEDCYEQDDEINEYGKVLEDNTYIYDNDWHY